MNVSETHGRLRSHWPLFIVAIIAAALLVMNIGSGYLWADEGDTAVLGSNILKSGLPSAWDGLTFMDSDFGARVNTHLIMVSSPWLQYYVTAASFLLLGQNTFAARLPFALAGVLTIGLVYLLVWRATADRRAALGGAILTICSVQFLLFCRQSRYYALAMFFTCLLIDSFLRLRSAKRAALFGIAAVLLFHTHPIGIVPVFALGVLTLIDRAFAPQRRYLFVFTGHEPCGRAHLSGGLARNPIGPGGSSPHLIPRLQISHSADLADPAGAGKNLVPSRN